ncbi:MAG: bifunctional folylpolyglutamate synthase/dihydrofolate synthase, partial [Desulfobacteraceae bacterium]
MKDTDKIFDYPEALRSLYALQKFGIKFGLSKTSNLLATFDNPHLKGRYVHIGGTNGKGSVAAMIESTLIGAGYRVGLYTSPHLVRFTERFRVNGREIEPEVAAGLTRELLDASDPEEPPTFFEVVTAMALVYFAREEVDIAIMEVGMGGRLDATNVIRPLVSVITNISMEHQAYLGKRLMDIAREKAGIIKPGVDLVTGVIQEPVIRLYESICREKGTAMIRLGKDVRYRGAGRGFNYHGAKWTLKGLEPGLSGGFQHKNGALAAAV